jgi:hypothetical protein
MTLARATWKSFGLLLIGLMPGAIQNLGVLGAAADVGYGVVNIMNNGQK